MNPFAILAGFGFVVGAIALALTSDKPKKTLPGQPKPKTPTRPPRARPPSGPKAKQLAPILADNIQTKGRGYNRDLLRGFQTAAGITVDGIYGGQSAGALAYWLGIAGSPLVNPPDPLYKPYTIRPYTPPASIKVSGGHRNRSHAFPGMPNMDVAGALNINITHDADYDGDGNLR